MPQGAGHVGKLIAMVEDPASGLLEAARPALRALAPALTRLEVEIQGLEAEIVRRAKGDEVARRLMTIPGVEPLIATALVALAPPPAMVRRGCDVAAWLGRTPRQHSTGGKRRLGATTTMGERSLRRLLIIGANSVVQWRARQGPAPGSWLAGMLSRKPPMRVRVALANSERRGATGSSPPRTARIVWALMAKGQVYRAPVVAA